MCAILYLQLDENMVVSHPHVYLQDIARLSCSDPEILHRLRVIPVIHLDPKKKERRVMSVMDLVDLIHQKEPDLEIIPLGEPDFIITYKPTACPSPIWVWAKVLLVCLLSFFGSAFSIMTFNTDVDVGGLFQKLYTQVTGNPSSGFTILEISYSIGIGAGIIFFFNHFGKARLTSDPTPMQVQMRLYENDINETIIEDINRANLGQFSYKP